MQIPYELRDYIGQFLYSDERRNFDTGFLYPGEYSTTKGGDGKQEILLKPNSDVGPLA